MATLRMRTLDEAFSELVADDPKCCLTKTALRGLVVSGTVRSVKIGRKYLVDMSALESFLREGTALKPEQPRGGSIRRVEV